MSSVQLKQCVHFGVNLLMVSSHFNGGSDALEERMLWEHAE